MSRQLDSTKYPEGFYKNRNGGHKIIYLMYNEPNLATISWVDTEDYYNKLAGFPVCLQSTEMTKEGQEVAILGITRGTITLFQTHDEFWQKVELAKTKLICTK